MIVIVWAGILCSLTIVNWNYLMLLLFGGIGTYGLDSARIKKMVTYQDHGLIFVIFIVLITILICYRTEFYKRIRYEKFISSLVLVVIYFGFLFIFADMWWLALMSSIIVWLIGFRSDYQILISLILCWILMYLLRDINFIYSRMMLTIWLTYVMTCNFYIEETDDFSKR